MEANRQWFVIDEGNNSAWDEETESGRAFDTYEAALKHARELAEAEPGMEVIVAESHTVVTAPVGEVETHPFTKLKAK